MKRILTAAAVAALVFTATSAQAQMKPEEVLKARQGIYNVFKMNFAPLGAMAKGETPYSAETVSTNIANIQSASKLLGPTYAPQFNALPNSNAKPEIWTNQAELGEKAKAFQGELTKLAELAKSGTEADVKAQIGAVGKTCKGCHDTFRKE